MSGTSFETSQFDMRQYNSSTSPVPTSNQFDAFLPPQFQGALHHECGAEYAETALGHILGRNNLNYQLTRFSTFIV
jgi:hypothetical protein